MYHKTVEEVIATLYPENGEVFILSNGRRMLFDIERRANG